MRKELSASLLKLAAKNPEFVFLTGDLGFMAFEELQLAMGDRFVNMGISEQNMISVAASLACDGNLPFVYSIAPFVVARPFEQIRNELGLHRMPVKIIANGGGYGYGIMGSTHHCLEDIALMRSVMNMVLYLPTFNEDVEEVVEEMVLDPNPNYLRLNNSSSRPATTGTFAPFRQLSSGNNGVLIGAGPVLLNALKQNETYNLGLNIWAIGKIPFADFPADLVKQIMATGKIMTLEEHNQPGGIGELVAFQIMKDREIQTASVSFNSLSAHGYPSGNYGDQNWHQEENHLAGPMLTEELKQFFQP